MHSYDTRRENLRRLLQHRGARTALAVKLDCGQSHISHVMRDPHLPGARRIDERLARRIERALNIEENQLDWPNGSTRPAVLEPKPAQLEVSIRAHRQAAPLTPGQIDKDGLVETLKDALAVTQQAAWTPDRVERLANIVMLGYLNRTSGGRPDAGFIEQLAKIIK